MIFLILGVALWSIVHFIPSLAQPLKKSLIQSLGDKAYKGLFAASIICSVLLIVYGWKHTIPSYLYVLPPMVRHITMLLVLIAFIFLGAAHRPTRLKNSIRHPMLLGVIVWSSAHLLVNGDSRSVVLFGGMGVWAILEILFINRRDTTYTKPDAPGWAREIRGLLISFVIFFVVFLIHPYIAGVPLR